MPRRARPAGFGGVKEITRPVALGVLFRVMIETIETTREDFTVSTDKSRLQIEVIHGFLSGESYWARERTLDQTRTAIEHSVCFGLYEGDRQIGFARVVTDLSTFAYLGDVFVLPEHQGRGLGKFLMEAVLGHPDLQGFRRWILATLDAHGLYGQYGFSGLKHPERWMELAAPNAY